jgi:hypothetical protein
MQTTHRLHAPPSHTPCPSDITWKHSHTHPTHPIPPAPYVYVNTCMPTYSATRTHRQTHHLPSTYKHSTTPHLYMYRPAGLHTRDIPERILPPSLPRFFCVNDWRLASMPSPTPAAAFDANPRLFCLDGGLITSKLIALPLHDCDASIQLPQAQHPTFCMIHEILRNPRRPPPIASSGHHLHESQIRQHTTHHARHSRETPTSCNCYSTW